MARILLVDDDPIIIKLYQIILKKADFTVDVATTGEAMMLAVNNQKPDLVLLDVVLPDCTGLELCSRLKNTPEYADIKIILVSGTEVTSLHVAEGIDIGADDYLVKPFDAKELMARIKNWLKLKMTEDELKDKNIELKKLSNHLQNIREEERQLTAREVQEEVGQMVAALKMDIDWLGANMPAAAETQKNRITHASETAKQIIYTIRKIASSLRPSMLDELGLNASLEWQCKGFSSENNIPCYFKAAADDEGISKEITTTLYRICEKSLKNIQQHSGATLVKVSLEVNREEIKFCIVDNGKGFATDKQKENAFGLISMRERAHAINGHLLIESKAGEGTTVLVIVPKR